MEMQANSGEIPTLFVQADSNSDGVLTPDPIAQSIANSSIMTRYPRQLNRCNGKELLGHNDSVVRNISQHFSQLRRGQWITVKVSYFESKGLNSGTYEIKSLGIFPPAKPLAVPTE